ncbi:MAG: glycerate kinase [Candidatus Limnocylindrales bacterium]
MLSSRTILIAPDSFKGSLTSVEVARALAEGWRRARPADEILLCPLADGGEGTLAAIEAAGGWQWQTSEVTDPLGRRILARWLRSVDGTRAVIEMAEASGLSRVDPAERDPAGATSAGVGDLLEHVARSGATDVTLGIGGSATTDAGFGMLDALGMGFEPSVANPRGVPSPLDRVWLHELGLHVDLRRVALQVACDVTNPLLGPSGAASTYGPQKGATPDEIALLDERIGRFADLLEDAAKRSERDTPGAGAAGGVGFALLAIQGSFSAFALRPGVDLVMEATDFDAKLARADLVITGEGRIDAQTAFGKTALGVARRAQAQGVPCIAVGGGVEPAGIEALAAVGAIAVPVVERAQTVDEAMAAGSGPLERSGERLARLMSIGSS